MKLFDRQINKMMNEHMPHKRRKRLIFFIAVITLLSMTTSTVAWFTINTFVGVDKLDLHISLAPQLKVAMHDYGTDLDKYVKVITNEMIDGYLGSKYNTKLADIILDPVTTTDGVKLTNRGGTVREPNKKSYLEFECYFIATEDMWVHLTTESSDIAGDKGTSVTSESPSPRNEVVQCTRVGFTTESNGTAVYEPNKAGTVNGLSTFDISTPMSYSDSSRLFHLDELTPKKVTVRLWVDGEDPQCDDDVQDADLRVALSFVGTDDANVPIS